MSNGNFFLNGSAELFCSARKMRVAVTLFTCGQGRPDFEFVAELAGWAQSSLNNSNAIKGISTGNLSLSFSLLRFPTSTLRKDKRPFFRSPFAVCLLERDQGSSQTRGAHARIHFLHQVAKLHTELMPLLLGQSKPFLMVVGFL